MNCKLAMSVFDPKINFVKQDPASSEFLNFLKFYLEPHEMKRLDAYSNNLIDYPLGETNLKRPQMLTFFMKVMKRLCEYLNNLISKDTDSTISRLKVIKMEPHSISVDEDLNDAARKVQDEMKDKSEGLLDPELFQQFAIVDREAEFGNALQKGGRKIVPGSVISVKSKKTKLEKHSKPETEKSGEKEKTKTILDQNQVTRGGVDLVGTIRFFPLCAIMQLIA